MKVGQLILPCLQRVQHFVVVNPLGDQKPTLVAGLCVQLGETLIQTAVLGVQHLLHLRLAQGVEHASEVLCQAIGYLQRRGIAPAPMHVKKPSEDLVHGVEGRPASIKIKAARTNVPAHHLGENLLAVHDGSIFPLASECAHIARSTGHLGASQLGHYVVRPLPASGIARLLVDPDQRRCVVAQRVAGEGVALPAAVDLALRRKPRILQKVV